MILIITPLFRVVFLLFIYLLCERLNETRETRSVLPVDSIFWLGIFFGLVYENSCSRNDISKTFLARGGK